MAKLDRESLELKIDQVNSKLLEYMNNSFLSHTDSDISSPLIRQKSLEETEMSLNDKYLIGDE